MAKETITCGADPRVAAARAAAVLRSGGIVVFPTETVYGVGVAAADRSALEKLRRLKDRPAEKPFQFLAADVAMAKRLGAVFSGRAERLADSFWPGALTLVLPDGRTPGGTLGIRIPDSPFVLALCRELGTPVITSSANAAGGPPPATAADADAFGDAVDLLVDGGAAVGGIASTVVQCDGDVLEILRRGGIAEAAIRAVWDCSGTERMQCHD